MIDPRGFLSLASRAFGLSVVWGMGCVAAVANPVNISYLEGQIPVAPDAVAAYGPDLFGDKVNLFNGSLVFEHTDLSLPGNNALPVALVRKHTPGRDWSVRGQFGDWDMETPRIGGSFSSIRGWVSQNSDLGRCSGGLLPPTVSSAGSIDPIFQRPRADLQLKATDGSTASSSSGSNIIAFIASDYWNGTYLHVPGQGSQELLRRAPNYNNRPNDGVASYPFVTHENWQISCLPSIQNGSGEGFVAVSPQGVRYRFDWLASRWQTQVKKAGASIGRMDLYLMATEVSDRFGNRVTYQYDSANPLLLTRIESTDGRVLTVTNFNGRAIAASDGTRTFSYTYDTAGNLSAVTQPDGSSWAFNLAPMVPDPGYNATVGEGANCDYPGDFSPEEMTGTITHPTGAVGRFTTTFNVLGRSGVQRVCVFRPNTRTNPIGAVWPRYYLTNSLTSKQISGPGMQTMLWTYSISAPGSWDTCTTCVDTRTVTVGEPNGSQTRHIFGSRWRVNEGQLLRVEEGWNGSSALRTTAYRYRSPAGQSYVEQFGTSPLRNNDWLSSRHRPLDQRITQVQGASFTWEVGDAISPAAGFDSRVRPVLVRKFSSLGNARSEAYSYHDNDARWVLGQLARVQELTTGLVPESHGFNADALVISSSSFGKQNFSYSYNADGTLSTVSDAAGRTTQLFNFRRGKPQQVLHADGVSESQVINNLGNADSQTDAAFTTTSYLYDSMGRVSQVIYPTGHPRSVSFVQSPVPAYGLPAGHWQQSVSTGNARKVRYFDGLWRERLALQFDAANPPPCQYDLRHLPLRDQ